MIRNESRAVSRMVLRFFWRGRAAARYAKHDVQMVFWPTKETLHVGIQTQVLVSSSSFGLHILCTVLTSGLLKTNPEIQLTTEPQKTFTRTPVKNYFTSFCTCMDHNKQRMRAGTIKAPILWNPTIVIIPFWAPLKEPWPGPNLKPPKAQALCS